MKTRFCRISCLAVTLAAVLAIVARSASAQGVPVSWQDSGRFQFNILSISLDKTVLPWKTTVVFTISDPTYPDAATNPQGALWDILTDAPFKTQPNPAPFPPSASPRLSVDVGWDTSDYTNNSVSPGSDPKDSQVNPAGAGTAPAVPVSVNALAKASRCDMTQCPSVDPVIIARAFYVEASISPVSFSPAPDPVRTGVVTIWGHPVIDVGVDSSGATIWGNVPVKSVFKYFTITDSGVARRQVVDIAKCKRCHDGELHGTTVIPRLTLHGTNRTEEPGVCVVCHNPSQTDIGYRTSGPEESVDFKRMVHGIHAGGMRRNPLVIIGRLGSVNDFSGVRFPAELSNCLLCHVENNGKGTFELPLAPGVLGSTINTGSKYNTPGAADGYVDRSPWNDLRITPTAAACSGCHDSGEVKRHMVSKGASFAATQNDIWAGNVKEQCASCHGPGKDEDVRNAHEIGRGDDHDDSLRIESAVYKVEDKVLRVSGERAPRNATVAVFNATTGVWLGTSTADREGKWKLAVQIPFSQRPRSITARAGEVSATSTVKFD